jgi:hypothetical protein
MKARWIQLIAVLAMFVLCISVCTNNAHADEVWRDDFEGPLEDWTIFAYPSHTDVVKIEGNFSTADGTLKVLDDDINTARHNSTVNIGTWSFDMFVPDDDEGFLRVEFMSNGASLDILGNMSWVAVSAWLDEAGRGFYVLYGFGSGRTVHQHITDIPLQGWHHIDVSRNSSGYFKVYFNETLKANFTNPSVTSSTYLQVVCDDVSGGAIDNLVVDDEPIPDPEPTTPTTPTPTPSPTPTPIDPVVFVLIGGIGVGVVIILAIVLLRRR